VVDVRTEGVQRNAPLTVELGTAHLRATKAASNLDANTLGASALSALQTLAHCTTECHTSSELLGNPLRNKLSVSLRVLYLKDVQLDLLAGELLEVSADALSLCPTAANDDAGTC